MKKIALLLSLALLFNLSCSTTNDDIPDVDDPNTEEPVQEPYIHWATRITSNDFFTEGPYYGDMYTGNSSDVAKYKVALTGLPLAPYDVKPENVFVWYDGYSIPYADQEAETWFDTSRFVVFFGAYSSVYIYTQTFNPGVIVTVEIYWEEE